MLFWVKYVASFMTRQEESWSTSPLDPHGAAREDEYEHRCACARESPCRHVRASRPWEKECDFGCDVRHLGSIADDNAREGPLGALYTRPFSTGMEIACALECEKKLQHIIVHKCGCARASASGQRVPKTKKIKNKPVEENSGHVHALRLLSERLRAAQLEITHLTPMPEDVEVINAIKEQVQAFHVNS